MAIEVLEDGVTIVNPQGVDATSGSPPAEVVDHTEANEQIIYLNSAPVETKA